MKSGSMLTPRALSFRNQFNKISWQSSNPYNKRWQFKWKPSYYTYPRDQNLEFTKSKRPEDSWNTVPLGWAWVQDIMHRHVKVPGFTTLWDRRERCFDKFNVYFLTGQSVLFYQFYDLAFSFKEKLLTLVPLAVIYIRCRDRVLDPDFKETYLRDVMHRNAEIAKYFTEETLHVLDYDCEYDKGFQDPEKFPEFQNRVNRIHYYEVWRFFNSDTSMTTGYFKIGDVESGAVMNLKFKTMPVSGRFRYQVGEPFYFYDLRADISHNGVTKEVVIVDEKETLKKKRPFLFLI